MSAQQPQNLRMTFAHSANHRRVELARRRVETAAAVVPPPPPAAPRVRVPRIHHCSFCFSSDGHNIGRCTHIDVEYLYWEMMYFYRYYGEHFLCNNLSVLFQPTEVHALLNHRPIKNIPLLNEADMWARMVVDVMHSPVIYGRYEKLHKKIISMSAQIQNLNYGRMDIVEPILYETIRAYENEIGERMDYSTILTGYHHTFTVNRHARFRRYDYDMEYVDSIPIEPRELNAYHNQYNPPPMFGNYDMGRYGFARMYLTTSENANIFAEELDTNEELHPVEEEVNPEWMTETNQEIVGLEALASIMRNVTQIRGNGHGGRGIFSIEEISFITRLFEDNYKNAQPETEVKVVEESYEKMEECLECPICMLEIKHSESVSLGCCVYSFCSDCYANQYLTKEHRAHNCMMCRAPFSQIEVFEEAIAEKLRAKCPASIIQEEYYYQERTERDDDGHYGLPMTLSELS